MTEPDTTDIGHMCREYYFDQDRMNAAQKSYQNAVDFWENAACTSKRRTNFHGQTMKTSNLQQLWYLFGWIIPIRLLRWFV